MVHGKAVCGIEDQCVVFDVNGGYAAVYKDGEVYLKDYWADMLTYDPLSDASLLSDSCKNRFAKMLDDADEKKVIGRLGRKGKEGIAEMEKLQDEMLELSRNSKKPVYFS